MLKRPGKCWKLVTGCLQPSITNLDLPNPHLSIGSLAGRTCCLVVNEFAARLPSALFGIGLILLQYRFLTRVVGSTMALLGSLILLLNMQVLAIHRMVLTDPALVFFTTLSGYCFWLGIRQEGKTRLYFFGFYIAMALAMLAKGPVGILIPLLGCDSLSGCHTPVETFWKSWLSCSWTFSCSRDCCPMVSGHVCHPWC